MHWQYAPYIWVYVAAAVIGSGMGAYAWRHRDLPGATSFACIEFSSALWSLANVLEKSRTDLATILFFVNIAWTAIAVVTPATLTLAMEYAGLNNWLSRRRVALLAAIPATMAILSWTNSYHGLLRHSVFLRQVDSLTVLGRIPGPLYAVSAANAYCTMFAALVIMFVALWRTPRPHRGQPIILIVGLLIIVSGSLAYNLGLNRLPFDISSIMFVPAGLAFMLGLFRYRLFDIAPIARDIVFENIHDSVIVVDTQGRVVDLNSAACRMLEPSSQQVIGQTIESLFAGRLGPLESVPSSPGAQKEITLQIAANQYHFDLRTSPMLDRRGRLMGRVLVMRDTTDRRLAEEALRDAKMVAEAATRAKSNFLATMSHEIRTPMNAVLGMTDLVLETKLNGDQREMVEMVRDSGEVLLTIINDILDFSKIESGKLELEQRPFHLRHCVEETLRSFSSRASKKSLELTYVISPDAPAMIGGDVTRLRQILFNLIGNALKFTESGEVTVSVSAAAHDSSRCELSFAVRDTGMGIPADRLHRLFQSFSQLDASTTRKYGGTGLGLAICKRLAEAMGGRIWVESGGAGTGSTFHFTILAGIVDEMKRDRSAAESASVQGLSGKRLLIVEPNETNQITLAGCARRWGMSANAVPSRSEALAVVSGDVTFDLAVIDMELPDGESVSLAKEIKRRCKADLPLIALTWMGRREYEAEGSLFAAHFTKPIEASLFFDAVIGALHLQPVHSDVRATETKVVLKMAEEIPLRILLAEDNLINQKVALYTLGRLGYSADVAATGVEVLEALSRRTYDVVLMDVHMPELDGIEATRLIRRKFTKEQQPTIIALTADAMQEDRELCLQAGMDYHISKPLRLEELIGTLRQVRAPREMMMRADGSSQPSPIGE